MRFGSTAHPGFESRSLRPYQHIWLLAHTSCAIGQRQPCDRRAQGENILSDTSTAPIQAQRRGAGTNLCPGPAGQDGGGGRGALSASFRHSGPPAAAGGGKVAASACPVSLYSTPTVRRQCLTLRRAATSSNRARYSIGSAARDGRWSPGIEGRVRGRRVERGLRRGHLPLSETLDA
jgi:hypothetical protein